MAGRLSPLGITLKWLVVPIALAAVGYFLVGPRVENNVPEEYKQKAAQVMRGESSQPEKSENEADATPASNQSKFAEPQVDVTVTALGTRQDPPKRKKRRRRKPKVETPAPTETAPAIPPDNAGEPPPPADGL
ncbi:MAG TPA: hypothetical protein VJ835_04830 [Fimbriimonadaceae bacterium]|nr:hypothetical protein [Fimbriimonadaceae bacterium]